MGLDYNVLFQLGEMLDIPITARNFSKIKALEAAVLEQQEREEDT